MTTDLIEVEMKKALTTALPDEARNAKRAAMFLGLVTDMTVESRADYDLATGELRGIKEAWDTMEADRTSFTAPLNAVLDKLNARFQPHLKVLKEAEKILKAKIATFLLGETARATEARETAEQEAASERERLATQAAELRAQAAKAKSPATRQRIEQQAAAIEQTAAVVIAQPVTTPMTRGGGISSSKTVDFELTDLLALVQYIATNRPDLVVLLKLDEVKVRAMVKMLGLHTELPGLRVFLKTGISVR